MAALSLNWLRNFSLMFSATYQTSKVFKRLKLWFVVPISLQCAKCCFPGFVGSSTPMTILKYNERNYLWPDLQQVINNVNSVHYFSIKGLRKYKYLTYLHSERIHSA